MKRNIATILFVIPSFVLLAQVNYYDSRENILTANQKNKEFKAHIAANKIASEQTFSYKHNNPNGVLTSERRYDKKGNLIDWFSYKHGKIKEHSSNNYNDSNWQTSWVDYKGTKLKFMEKLAYDKAGNIIEDDWYGRDTLVINGKTIKTYDNRNNITESKLFSNGKLMSKIEYSYYDDGSKKQTIAYSGKGKVKGIWNFDCNPVGQQQAKKLKDTSKICIHYETDKDGNPVKVKEEYIGGKGLFVSTERNVIKYDKNNNVIDNVYYDFKGKPIDHYGFSYNALGKQTESIVYKNGGDKIYMRTVYAYNNDGLVSELVEYNKSQAPFYTLKYVYTSSVSSPVK